MSNFLNYSIQSKKDLKNWIFRQLGYPLVTPWIRNQHLEDFINDSLQEFTQYAYQDPAVFAFNLNDYIAGKGYKMPNNILAVTNLYDYGVHNSSSNAINPFSFGFMMVNGGFVPSPFNGRSARSGWFDYSMAMSWLDLTYQMTGKGFDWNYNPRTHYLTLNPDPIKYFHLDPQENGSQDGNWCVAQVLTLRPDQQLYGQTWVKRMALAKAKIFVGQIRKLDGGVSLPGGTTIDGDTFLSQGKQQQKQLREQLTKRYPIIGMWHG